MKYCIWFLLFLNFVISGCNASDENDIKFFIDHNLKLYLEDDREILLTLNENIDTTPFPVKEAIFDKAYIKIMTAKSLLDNDKNSWVDALNKNGFDYVNLDTLCWSVSYIKTFSDNMDLKYKAKLNQETKNNINNIYGLKKEIIKLRDSKDEALKSTLKLCK